MCDRERQRERERETGRRENGIEKECVIGGVRGSREIVKRKRLLCVRERAEREKKRKNVLALRVMDRLIDRGQMRKRVR